MSEASASEPVTVEVPVSQVVQIKVEAIKREQLVVEDDDEATVQCPRCSKSFYNRTALRNHLNHTHGVELEEEEMDAAEPRSQVMTGTPASSRSKDLTTALMSELSPKLVSLASKDVSYIIVKTVGGHMDTKSNEPNTKRRRTNSESPRRRNATPVQLTGPFECLQRSSSVPGATCHQVFFNCCEYSLHYRRDHTKRRKPGLRCQVCEKQLDGMVRAEGAVDPEAARTCGACGARFGDPCALAAHLRSAHAKPKPFSCSVCMKSFTQQGGLMQHMRMHTGDRPFPCTVCGKAFTQKAGLDQHLRIHTKIKPFRCVVCDKSFSQSVHLRQHMRTHTNIQPFQCGACGRRFKQSSHLNFHIKSHQLDGGVITDSAEEVIEEYILDEGETILPE